MDKTFAIIGPTLFSLLPLQIIHYTEQIFGRAKHRTGLKYSTASLKYSTGCVNGVLWQC